MQASKPAAGGPCAVFWAPKTCRALAAWRVSKLRQTVGPCAVGFWASETRPRLLAISQPSKVDKRGSWVSEAQKTAQVSAFAAGLEARQTRPCTVFGAQNPTAHVFGRLPQASKPAKGGPAPFSGLRIRRRAALAAWRRLRTPANAALRRFRGSEPNDACCWPFGAGFESRQTRFCTVSEAQNPTAHVSDRLPRAWKPAKRGPALFSGPRTQRRTSSAACRRLRNPQKVALHRFQGSEYVGARLWPLGAGFELRQTRPCAVFGAQNPTTRAAGHLAQASKVDKRGSAPFPRPRIQRPTFPTACRGLGNPPNAALHCFRGPEPNGARLRPPAAGFETRKRWPCTVFRAQNTSARGFGRLAQASNSGKRGPAPFSGLRTQRRVLLAIWRRLRKSTNAVLHRFRGPESNGPRFRPLAAGFEACAKWPAARVVGF